jgi:hypothetical protein
VDATQLEHDIRRSPAAALTAVREAGHGLIDDLMPEIAIWPHIHHMPPVELPPSPSAPCANPSSAKKPRSAATTPAPVAAAANTRSVTAPTETV